jgi:nitrogen-specific signal transduction histidine kinase
MAAQLLNMSARHLENRVITLFIQDRDAFISTLNELRHRTHRLAATFVVRPRERAAVTLDMVAVPVVPGETATWLWFLSRSTEPLRTRQQPSPSVNLESR